MSSYEYCSLYYLNLWLKHDSSYCASLSEGSRDRKLDALNTAAKFYRISRNLPTIYDVGKGFNRFEPVLSIIDEYSKDDFKVSVASTIREIERRISMEYGNRNVLSLTTKFLWLKIKDPILIYDSLARKALDTKMNDIDQYYDVWQSQFDLHKTEIQEVCKRLPSMHKYTIDHVTGNEGYIEEISARKWFHERVFDIYLWSVG